MFQIVPSASATSRKRCLTGLINLFQFWLVLWYASCIVTGAPWAASRALESSLWRLLLYRCWLEGFDYANCFSYTRGYFWTWPAQALASWAPMGWSSRQRRRNTRLNQVTFVTGGQGTSFRVGLILFFFPYQAIVGQSGAVAPFFHLILNIPSTPAAAAEWFKTEFNHPKVEPRRRNRVMTIGCQRRLYPIDCPLLPLSE